MVHWWVGGCCWSMGCKIPFSGQLWMKNGAGFQLIDCLRKPHSSSMEEPLSQLSHMRLSLGAGVLSARLLLHVEPNWERKRKKTSIENRGSIVLYNLSIFLGCKAYYYYTSFTGSTWGMRTCYKVPTSSSFGKSGELGEGGSPLIFALPPPQIKEEEHVCFGIYIGSCVTKIWYTHWYRTYSYTHLWFLNVQCTWVRLRDRSLEQQPSSQPASQPGDYGISKGPYSYMSPTLSQYTYAKLIFSWDKLSWHEV